MKIHELGLNAESEYRLARLAMAVEVHCKQRFSVRKDVMDVAAMLVVADTSDHQLVRQRRSEFMASLQAAARSLLASLTGEDEAAPSAATLYRGSRLGAELLDGIHAAGASTAVRTYRGQMIG